MNTRGINENDLRCRTRPNPRDPVACRLWLGCNDGNLLAQQLIEQSRLSDVGATYDGNIAGAKRPLLCTLVLGVFLCHK